MICDPLDKAFAEIIKERYNTLWMEHLGIVKDATEKINASFLSYANYGYPDIWLDPPNKEQLQNVDNEYVELLSNYLKQEIESAKKCCIEKLERYAK